MSELYRVHPKLIPYISALASHEFGLLQEQAEIHNVESGSLIMERNHELGDRFILKILYCTKKLDWQVLMCPDNLSKPPDFLMGEECLSKTNFELIQSQVPSLANWQPENPKSLLYVVLELVRLYKLVQVSFYSNLLNKDSRMFHEYNALLRYTDLPIEDFEFLITSSSRLSFLAHLDIDYSKLPVTQYSGKYVTLILVEIERDSKNITTLIKSADLDEVYGNLNFPAFLKQNTLLHYFPLIRKQLQTKVDELSWRLHQRKLFCSYFYQALEPAILDIDNIWFRKLSFLLEYSGIYYVLKILIPLKYPILPPRIIISSMMNRRTGIPIFIPLDKFKYNARWDNHKIFSTIYEFIVLAAVPLYQRQIGERPRK